MSHPFLLPAEHVTARFGNEDSQSVAVFSITENLGHNISLSLFLRTRRPGGLLLLLTNSNTPVLRMWLEAGRVNVQLHNSENLTASKEVHDGEIHFVNVEVVETRMSLYVAGQKEGDVEVGRVSVQAGDVIFVGGLQEWGVTAELGGYFKGCIQDLRVNDRRLQFFVVDPSLSAFPVELMENVTAGCSGDDICNVSERRPILTQAYERVMKILHENKNKKESTK